MLHWIHIYHKVQIHIEAILDAVNLVCLVPYGLITFKLIGQSVNNSIKVFGTVVLLHRMPEAMQLSRTFL